MDEFYFRTSHVPAFGSWDCNNDLPFTQCFESARHYRYSYSEDRDLYVAGDLYENHVVTPAVIVVPRRHRGGHNKKEKGGDDGSGGGWVVASYDSKAPPSPLPSPPRRTSSKAVDEDLYKISPQLLKAHHPKRKRGRGFFSSCLQPSCVC